MTPRPALFPIAVALLACAFSGCGQAVDPPPPIPEGGAAGKHDPGPLVVGSGDASNGGTDNQGGRATSAGSGGSSDDASFGGTPLGGSSFGGSSFGGSSSAGGT